MDPVINLQMEKNQIEICVLGLRDRQRLLTPSQQSLKNLGSVQQKRLMSGRRSGTKLMDVISLPESKDLLEFGVPRFTDEPQRVVIQNPIFNLKPFPLSKVTEKACLNHVERLSSRTESILPKVTQILFKKMDKPKRLTTSLDPYSQLAMTIRFANANHTFNTQQVEMAQTFNSRERSNRHTLMTRIKNAKEVNQNIQKFIHQNTQLHVLNPNNYLQEQQVHPSMLLNLKRSQYQIKNVQYSKGPTAQEVVGEFEQHISVESSQLKEASINLPQFQVDVTVPQGFFDFPLEKHQVQVSNTAKYLQMQDLDEISFKDFVSLHKINPRLYMLNCDQHTQYPFKGEIPPFDKTGICNARRFQISNARLRQQQQAFLNTKVLSNTGLTNSLILEKARSLQNQMLRYSNPVPKTLQSVVTEVFDAPKEQERPLSVNKISRFEAIVRRVNAQMQMRSFSQALILINKQLSNFKASSHFLKFNQALCYFFLAEFDKAVGTYRKLLAYPDENFKRNVLHNLIICSEIYNQPSEVVMFHLKENSCLQERYTKDLHHIMFQKLVAFMKQNYLKFQIPDVQAVTSEEEQQLLKINVKRRTLSTKQVKQEKLYQVEVETTPVLAFEAHFKLNIRKQKQSIQASIQSFRKSQTFKNSIGRLSFDFKKEQEIKKLEQQVEREIKDIKKLLQQEQLDNKLSSFTNSLGTLQEISSILNSNDGQQEHSLLASSGIQSARSNISDEVQVLPTKLKDLVWPSLGRYIEQMQDQLIMMLKGNAVVDPVTVHYHTMMTNIKQLCDTPNITRIIINNLLSKGQVEQQNQALSNLTEAATLILSQGVAQVSDVERDFLVANVYRIKKLCERELGLPDQ